MPGQGKDVDPVVLGHTSAEREVQKLGWVWFVALEYTVNGSAPGIQYGIGNDLTKSSRDLRDRYER